jgi:hypothetical protein
MHLFHRFNDENKFTGERFYYEFMNMRNVNPTSLVRVIIFSKLQLSRFFSNLELMDKYSFAPSPIFC